MIKLITLTWYTRWAAIHTGCNEEIKYAEPGVLMMMMIRESRKMGLLSLQRSRSFGDVPTCLLILLCSERPFRHDVPTVTSFRNDNVTTAAVVEIHIRSGLLHSAPYKTPDSISRAWGI